MTTEIQEKYNIVCLSNQLWNYALPTNKKHVMTRAAQAGHRVLFIDPVLNTGRLFFRQLFRGEWSLKRLLFRSYSDKEVGLKVITPLNFLPFATLLAKLHSQKIQKVASKYFDSEKKTILWIYNVELSGLEHFVKNIKHDILIYDCVDNYAGFPKYSTQEKKDWVNSQEKWLAEKADIVFATAPGLVSKLKKYNSKVFFTPNVGDYEKHKDVRRTLKDIPEDLEKISKPRVGFVGAVDEYKFDRDLLKFIAQENPTLSFVVVGPIALKDREANLKELGFDGLNNVHFLGSKPYKDVHKYYAGLDAFIIPFVLNDYTVGGCFPIKFHDALSAGLPVVVTNMPAYLPFSSFCYISKTYAEFSENIRKALAEDSEEKINQREEVASQNSWEGKVSKLFMLIRENLPQSNS